MNAPFFAAGQAIGLPECMGGWCGLRHRCPQYGDTAGRGLEDRLCLPDQDGQLNPAYLPVQFVRRLPHSAWGLPAASAGLMAPANPFDGLLPV